jgi:hypothetical protein
MRPKHHCEAAKPTQRTAAGFTSVAMTLILVSATAGAQDLNYEFGGHTKLRMLGQSYADDSLFRDLVGATSADIIGELRLNFAAKRQQWSFFADYQLLGIHSEFLSLDLPNKFLPSPLPNDDNRLFDFTKDLNGSDDNAFAHRLDRLWVGYSGEKTVLRFGRQALSWGNGLFFAPMDLVNPFDPTTIDTEYKTGDDMLYLQYLRDSGDDWQAAAVFRRDPPSGGVDSNRGDVDSDQSTVALKYHGFAGEYEYDVLFAESYDETVIGIGGARSIGGAIWRGDVVVTDTNTETVVEVVTNLSYSWVWGGKNLSGGIEYYHDGVDSNYLAASLTVEMSPLWIMTPTLVSNVDDQSALLQVVTQYSLSDNMTFLGSLNIPLGANGTEFGGPESGVPSRYLSFDLAVFAQLAWYF